MVLTLWSSNVVCWNILHSLRAFSQRTKPDDRLYPHGWLLKLIAVSLRFCDPYIYIYIYHWFTFFLISSFFPWTSWVNIPLMIYSNYSTTNWFILVFHQQYSCYLNGYLFENPSAKQRLTSAPKLALQHLVISFQFSLDIWHDLPFFL